MARVGSSRAADGPTSGGFAAWSMQQLSLPEATMTGRMRLGLERLRAQMRADVG